MINDLVLGRTADGKDVRIPSTARMYNTHIIGRPHQGKSKLIAHMIEQDIRAGQGVLVLDPHGTLYKELVEWAAQNEIDKYRNIILVDPSDPDQCVGFNPFDLSGIDEDPRNTDLMKVASDIVGAVSSVWGDEDMSKTPRLQRILRNTFYLIAHHQLTMVESRALLGAPSSTNKATTFSEDLREYLMQDLDPDSLIAQEWRDMQEYTSREFLERTESTINRIISLVGSRVGRNMLGQQERVLDLRKAADNQDVVLVNLSQGSTTLDEQGSRLIGTLMLNQLVRKMWGRPEDLSMGKPFCVYIDECYKFLGKDVSRILDEMRKFGVRLHVAHQRMSQLEEEGSKDIKSAVVNLADNKVIFAVGGPDSRELAEHVFLGRIDHQRTKQKIKTYQTVGTERVLFEGRGRVTTKGRSDTVSDSDGSSSESVSFNADGEAAAHGTTTSSGAPGNSSTESESESTQTQTSEGLSPIIEEMSNTPYSYEEQMEEKAGELNTRPPQHALLHMQNQPHYDFKVDFVPTPIVADLRMAEFRQNVARGTSVVSKPVQEIELEISNRLKLLQTGVREFTQAPSRPQDDDFSS